MRAPPPRVWAALVALAVGAAGCEGCRGKSPREGVGEEEASPAGAASPPPRRVGVKVPLPPGWSNQPTQDGSLQFGPPQHPVLRVDLRPNEGASLPEPEALLDSVSRAFEGFTRSDARAEKGTDFVMVRVMLAATGEDAGESEAHPAFIGARRVGRDLFLCASLPGVTVEEVQRAAEACAGIHVPANVP
ncbi:hypothetical protein [Melittangium boletus]|uniref:Lipoprotein n=1 Tax=Melittangium boletus DSM 14713 TaxID=1294270 RepID=A0A250IFB3_9BACT|nr:hypothetical protein [Melittangium boletus]ATB29831.1 hypothetical protein MEBOL_003286 [Melittangium boletus DSM 14713]